MAIPSLAEMKRPLLDKLVAHEGQASLDQLYQVISRFPLTPAELDMRSKRGNLLWKIRIRQTMRWLAKQGEAIHLSRGVWAITERGRKRLAGETEALTFEVKSAEEATEIARSFIKKYRVIALPIKASRENDIWLVDIDVGPLAVKVAKVKVAAKTGSIMSYEIPEMPPI